MWGLKGDTWEHKEIQTFLLLFPPYSPAVVGTYHGSPDQSHQVAGNHQQPPQQSTGFPRNSQPYYNSRGVSRGGSRGARGLMNGYRGPANGFRGEQLCKTLPELCSTLGKHQLRRAGVKLTCCRETGIAAM